MDTISTGINFGFEHEKFFVEYKCSREVANLRQEFEQRARELYSLNPKIMLGLSTGLDSQAVLHSFYTQGIPLEIAFLHFPGYNDIEFNQLQALTKKYNLKPIIVELDPVACKDEMMALYHTTGMPPYQWIHVKFLDQLPKDHDFIQGIHGPDFTNRNGQIYIIETPNSLEISRLISLQNSKRIGKIRGWERTGEILLSLLTDDIVTAFLHSRNYIANNNLIYSNGDKVPIIDHWDLYFKPLLYGKYWRDELEYFPKYTGVENIEWLDKKWHNYSKDLALVPYDELVEHLSKKEGKIKRYYAE